MDCRRITNRAKATLTAWGSWAINQYPLKPMVAGLTSIPYTGKFLTKVVYRWVSSELSYYINPIAEAVVYSVTLVKDKKPRRASEHKSNAEQAFFEKDALLEYVLAPLLDYKSYLNLKATSKKLNAKVKIKLEQEQKIVETLLAEKKDDKAIITSILVQTKILKYTPEELLAVHRLIKSMPYKGKALAAEMTTQSDMLKAALTVNPIQYVGPYLTRSATDESDTLIDARIRNHRGQSIETLLLNAHEQPEQLEQRFKDLARVTNIDKLKDLKQSSQQTFWDVAFDLAKTFASRVEFNKYFNKLSPRFANPDNLTLNFRLLLWNTIAAATNFGNANRPLNNDFFPLYLIARMLITEIAQDIYHSTKTHQTASNKLHADLFRLQFLLTKLSALERAAATPSIARSPYRLLREPAPIVTMHTTDLSAHIKADHKDHTHLGRKPKRK